MTSAAWPTTALAMLEFDATGRATGHRMADPGTPQLNVADLAATRGDGIFEAASLGSGVPQALEPHLTRFEHSAQMLALDLPDRAIWRAAVAAVAAALGAADGVPAEGFVKLVLTRGVEGRGVPTGWVFGARSPDFSAARRDGVRVVLLDRGYRHDVAHTSPWLLAGAKTISYAVNRAAAREAARRDADDVLFVSTDGYLLEGPSSNLILRLDGRFVTPRTDLGILAGTTQDDLFRWAEGAGTPTAYELLTRDHLERADAAWLVSSVRHVVPINAVDGVDRILDRGTTAAMNAFLRSRTE